MNFTPKRVAEVESFTLDFVSLLATGETIVTTSWAVIVIEGADVNSAAMLIGAAAVVGAKVSQLIGAGVAGVLYHPRCTVTTSGGQTLTLPDDGEGTLRVIA